MADVSVVEMKIMKWVKEAEKGLIDLAKDIRPVVSKLKDRSVDKDKALKARKKVLSFMGKYADVTKLQGSPIFAQLSDSAQEQVVWMDRIMGDLLKLSDQLTMAKKLADSDPDKKYTVLVKASTRVFSQMTGGPKGVGTLLKEMKKGIDTHSPTGALISILPMALLLWLIMDTILRGLKAKPKYK